jgi:hypothetical protein
MATSPGATDPDQGDRQARESHGGSEIMSTKAAAGTDSASRRPSRRSLIAGAAGAVGVLAVEALTHPTTALAGTDGDVVLGGANNAGSQQTSITSSASTTFFSTNSLSGGGQGLWGDCQSSSGGSGVFGSGGKASVWGDNPSSDPSTVAVKATAFGGEGVHSESTGSHGVHGKTGASLSGVAGVFGECNGPGSGVSGSNASPIGGTAVTGAGGIYSVWGNNATNSTLGAAGVRGDCGPGTGVHGEGSTGVQGHSPTGPGVEGDADLFTGVYGTHRGTSGLKSLDAGVVGDSNFDVGVAGFAPEFGVFGIAHGQPPFGVQGGVFGGSDLLVGVAGVSAKADGVYGSSGTANGVHGVASGTGAAVLAENPSGGPALRVAGPAVFSRSGLATIASGTNSVTVTGLKLSSASLVLATLQNHLFGIYVVAAVPNVAGKSITIYVNKAPTSPAVAKVAWFIVN